jgi:hypothetical protein
MGNIFIKELKLGDEVYYYAITLSVLKYYQKETKGSIDKHMLLEIVGDIEKLECLLYYALKMGHLHKKVPFPYERDNFSILFDQLGPLFLEDLVAEDSDLVSPKSEDEKVEIDEVKKN